MRTFNQIKDASTTNIELAKHFPGQLNTQRATDVCQFGLNHGVRFRNTPAIKI